MKLRFVKSQAYTGFESRPAVLFPCALQRKVRTKVQPVFDRFFALKRKIGPHSRRSAVPKPNFHYFFSIFAQKARNRRLCPGRQKRRITCLSTPKRFGTEVSTPKSTPAECTKKGCVTQLRNDTRPGFEDMPGYARRWIVQ